MRPTEHRKSQAAALGPNHAQLNTPNTWHLTATRRRVWRIIPGSRRLVEASGSAWSHKQTTAMANRSEMELWAGKDGQDMNKDALRFLLMLLPLDQHTDLASRLVHHTKRAEQAPKSQPRLGERAHISHISTYCEANASPPRTCAPSDVASSLFDSVCRKVAVMQRCLSQRIWHSASQQAFTIHEYRLAEMTGPV